MMFSIRVVGVGERLGGEGLGVQQKVYESV